MASRSETPAPPPAADPQARDLRSSTLDGATFSVMVGVGETYVPAFVLAAGHGEVAAGLIATLPILAGAIVQLVTPWGVRQVGSYRSWVVTCAALQALSFVPLVAGAAMGAIPFGWVALAAVAYWSFGMAAGPAWNAWITSLVPPERRAGFFARRSLVAQGALLAGVLAGGLLLEAGWSGSPTTPFVWLFAAAIGARLVSARLLAAHGESAGLAAGHRALRPREIFVAVRDANSLRLLGYLVMMQAAVNVAAPFFTPYMLGPLSLSYAEFMVLTAAAFVARVAILPALGRVAQQRGTRVILQGGAIGIVPLPALWLVSDAFFYLLAIQLLAGFAWAAVEYATLLAFFEGIEDRVRASVLTAYNLATALAMAIGAMLGGLFFDALGAAPTAYAALFVVSTLGRLVVLGLLREPEATLAEGTDPIVLRTVAVRPSAGALVRPVLSRLRAAPARNTRSQEA